MSIYERQFRKLPAILKELEKMAKVSFEYLVDSGVNDPMPHIANTIARKHAGKGYKYGLHADNAVEVAKDDNLTSIRLKDGHGVIVNPSHNDYYDINSRIGSLTALELVLFATAVKTSVNGYYMLVRYDLLACYANPYLKTNDSIWDFFDGILCECRSVVVDVRDMSIVSLPYYKFRNLGETSAYDIEHVRLALDKVGGKLIATEKLDGSMVQMTYTGDEDAFEHGLLFSTSGTLAGSDGAVGNDHIDAIVKWHLSGKELNKYLGLAKTYPQLTFLYEFVHPDVDRHVVLYDKDKHGLYLTGARNIQTGRLCNYNEIKRMATEHGILFPDVLATDIDSALDIQQKAEGSLCEGMVVNVGDALDRTPADSSGWLIKVKLDGFLALSHIHNEIEGTAGFKGIAKMLVENTLDDALPKLPDTLKDYIDAVVQRFEKFESTQRAVIEKLVTDGLEKSNGERKEFALYVNNLACPSHWKGWMFQTAFNGGVECFWADKNTHEWRFLSQAEFEDREAALEEWLKNS